MSTSTAGCAESSPRQHGANRLSTFSSANCHDGRAAPGRVATSRVPRRSVRARCVDAERAVVALATTVENETRETRTVRVTTEIRDRGGAVVATGSTPVTVLPGAVESARMRLYVSSPALWSVDAPSLYTAATTVTDGDRVLDGERTTFGIRALQLDPHHGLRINGETVRWSTSTRSSPRSATP
jgi:hypothetical protein